MEDLISQTLSSLRSMVDSDTVIGRTITAPNRAMVVPVSRVSVGLLSGTGDYTQGKKETPLKAGGGGAGGSVSPIGFLIMDDMGVRFVPVDKEENTNKWLNLFSSAIDVFKKD